MIDKIKNSSIIISAVGIIFCLLFLITFVAINQPLLNQVSKDTNQLLINDKAMATYIQQNSNALIFINGCMQTADHNNTISLECKKVIQ